MLEREEQVVEFHTWRSSAGKEVRRRGDHVGGYLLDVRLVVTLRVLFFHANQSLLRLCAAWGEPVMGGALETSTVPLTRSDEVFGAMLDE